MNKKGNFLFYFLIGVIILIIILLIALLIIDISNDNACEKACSDAVTYETKEGKSNMIDYLTGDYELNCVCYFSDGIETRRAR